MLIRRPWEIFENFKILKHLFQSSFVQTYLVSKIQTGEKFYLVEFERACIPASFQQEISLYPQSFGLIPPLIQKWEKQESVSFLFPEFQGLSVLEWRRVLDRLDEKQELALFRDLFAVFKAAFLLKLDCRNVLKFAEKIYQTRDTGMFFLPSPLRGIFQRCAAAPDLVRETSGRVSVQACLQSFAELFLFLLIKRPPGSGQSFNHLTSLGREREAVLENVILGQAKDFESLRSSFLSLGKTKGAQSPANKPAQGKRRGRYPRIPATRLWAARIARALRNLFRGAVGDEEMFVFIQSFSVLLESGVSFDAALECLAKQTQNPRFKKPILNVHSGLVHHGASLSSAMKSHLKFFPDEFLCMIRAGETSGNLGSALREISVYLQNRIRLKQKVKAASTYPVFAGGVCLVLFFVFFYFLLPKIMDVALGGLTVAYPLPTRMLIGALKFSRSPVVLAGLFSLALLYFPLRSFLRGNAGRQFADASKFKLPFFGTLYKNLVLTRFCSTLGSMMRSGVPFLESIELAAKSTGSRVFADLAADMQKKAVGGMTLAKIIAGVPFHPYLLRSMVDVGEETGRLDDMLLRTSRMYEAEVEYSIEQCLAFLEPAMVLAMGIAVCFVVLAVFLPIYSVVTSVSM